MAIFSHASFRHIVIRILFIYHQLSGLVASVPVYSGKTLVDFEVRVVWLVYQCFIFVLVNAFNLYIIISSWTAREVYSTSIGAVVITMSEFTYGVACILVSCSFIVQNNRFLEVSRCSIKFRHMLRPGFWPYYCCFIIGEITAILLFPSLLLYTQWKPAINNFRLIHQCYALTHLSAGTTIFVNLLILLGAELHEVNIALKTETSQLRIVDLLDAHADIWHACMKLNKLCGISNLFLVLLSFCELLYMVADTKEHKSLRTATLLWSISYLMRHLLTLVSATLTVHEAKKTSWLLCLTNGDERHVSDVVEEFAFQKLHNHYDFNACSLFPLNMKLLGSLISTTVAYGVLLVQLGS